MDMAGLRSAAPAGLTSGLKIAAVEAFRLRLPYKQAVAFHSVTEASGQYVILRLALDEGSEGIAEAVCRVAHSGEDAASVAYRYGGSSAAPRLPPCRSPGSPTAMHATPRSRRQNAWPRSAAIAG